jgi:hypothetical protein
MPQEIKYSKLEGEMATYVLGNTIPAEDEQKVSTLRQSFSQSISEGTVIQQASTGSTFDVYGSRWVAQPIINATSNVLKITKVAWYGVKGGTPPGDLRAEIRKINPSLNEIAIYTLGTDTRLAQYEPIGGDYMVAQAFYVPVSTRLTKVTFTIWKPTQNAKLALKKRKLLWRFDNLFDLTWTVPSASDNIPATSGTYWPRETLNISDAVFEVELSAIYNYSGTYIIFGTRASDTNNAYGFYAGYSSTAKFYKKIGGAETVLISYPTLSGNAVYLTRIRQVGSLHQVYFAHTNDVREVTDSARSSGSVFVTIGVNAAYPTADNIRIYESDANYIIIYGLSPDNYVELLDNTNAVIATATADSQGIAKIYVFNLPKNTPFRGMKVYTDSSKTTTLYSTGSSEVIYDNIFSGDEFEYQSSPSYTIQDLEVLLVECNDDRSPNLNKVITTRTVSASSIGTSPATVTISFSPDYPALTGGKYYAIVLRQKGGGTTFTPYAVRLRETHRQREPTYYPFFRSVDGGSTWKRQGGIFCIEGSIYMMALAPSLYPDAVLASASWTASEIGTSAAWYEKALDTPVYLAPGDAVVLLIYQSGGLGSSSNYYRVNYATWTDDNTSANDLYGPLNKDYWKCYLFAFLSSTDGGVTWSATTNGDLSFQIKGYTAVPLFSTNLVLDEKIKRVRTTVTARVLSGNTIYFLTKVGGSQVKESSTTAMFLTDVIVFPESEAIPDTGTVTLTIYVMGTGEVWEIRTQRFVCNEKKTITPKDLGFAELYLLKAEIPTGGSIRINEKTELGGGTHSFSEFNYPVKKVEIINTNTATLHFLGVK